MSEDFTFIRLSCNKPWCQKFTAGSDYLPRANTSFMLVLCSRQIILYIEQRLSVCLFVCSPTPPRSFDGSSPNLVGVCRWTSELPLRGSFLKSSTGQRSLFRSKWPHAILYDSRRHQAETTPLQKAPSKSLICLDWYTWLVPAKANKLILLSYLATR